MIYKIKLCSKVEPWYQEKLKLGRGKEDSEEKGPCYAIPLFVGAALEEEMWKGQLQESHVTVMVEMKWDLEAKPGDGVCGVLLWWDDSTIAKEGNKSIPSLEAPTFLCLYKTTFPRGHLLSLRLTHLPFL